MRFAKVLSSTVLLLIVGLGFGQDIRFDAEATRSELLRVAHLLQDEGELDSVLTAAIDNSPVLKAIGEDMNIYQEEYRQKSRNWSSSLTLSVNIFSLNTTTYEDRSVTTAGVLPNVGVGLTIDPEKIINRKSYMRQAEQKYRRSHHQQMAQKQLLQQQLIRMYYEYMSLLESLLLKEQSVETRRQHYNTVEIAFQNGEGTYEQLMIIQNQLLLAEQDLTDTHIKGLSVKRQIRVFLEDPSL